MFVLERQRKGQPDFERLWLLVIVALGAAGAAWLRLGLPTPACVFHSVTGVPCLTCGGTRCARSLLAGHFAQAAAWNPLVFALAAAAGIYALYAGVVLAFNLPRIRFETSLRAAERHTLLAVLALAAAANWIYLVYRFSHGA